MTKNGKQMSAQWINKNLDKTVSEDVFEDIQIYGYESILAKVSAKGNVTTLLLNNIAKEIGNWH